MIKKIENFFSRIIPFNYRKDPYFKKEIYKWLLIGLLIRFTIMPLTVYYPDLLAVYWRSSLIAYHGMHWIGGAQIVVHYFHALFLLIFKPLMPYFDSILNDPKMGYLCTWDMFYTFIHHPNVFRTLFLFKVPYFLFDMGCAFLFLNIFQDCKKGLYAFIFWIINPIVIFATYLAPRYESVATFFILLSLYYAKKNLSVKSLFFLGISIIIRLYPLILLPFFVIILGKNLSQRLKLAFWGGFPLGIITVLNHLFHHIGPIEGLAKLQHTSYLLMMQFPLMHYRYDRIFVFILAYTFLFLYALFKTNHSFKDLWKVNLIALLLFFATCFFHTHYLMWLIPFLTLEVVEDRRFCGLFVIQVLCFIVYTFRWRDHFAGFLFTPIAPSYFLNLKDPMEVIDQYYPASYLISIFRSIFSGVCLWMMYLIFKEFPNGEKEKR